MVRTLFNDPHHQSSLKMTAFHHNGDFSPKGFYSKKSGLMGGPCKDLHFNSMVKITTYDWSENVNNKIR